jgi:hypothetical protein
MMTVKAYAAPTPDISTPNSQAWGVSSGSWPMVRSNTHAARTETMNWNAYTLRTNTKRIG